MAARVACVARALTCRARAPRVRGLGTHGVVGGAPRWSHIARCSPPALAFPSSSAPARRLPRLAHASPPSPAGARRRDPRPDRSPWLAGVSCRALASSAPTDAGDEADDRLDAFSDEDAFGSETPVEPGFEIEVDVLVVDDHGGPPATGLDTMPIEALAVALERDARVLASTLVDPKWARRKSAASDNRDDADARDRDFAALESLSKKLFPDGPDEVSYVELSVALCTDAHIRALNAEWRGKDTATDVLSFPAETFGEVTVLGDCVVSVDTAGRQARDQRHGLWEECRVLLAHGVAHLAGMDHEDGEEEAAEMSRVESALLRALEASDEDGERGEDRAAPRLLGLIASAEAGERGEGRDFGDPSLDGNAFATMSVSNELEPSDPASAAAIPAIREKAEKQTLRFPRSVDVDPARRANRRADVLFVDLDGTLLNDKGVVTRGVADALRAAAEKGVLVCVATGKARPAARRALATALLDGAGGVTGDYSPGVFLQGLDVRAPGGGSISNASMPEDVVRDAFAFHGGEMRETRRVRGDANANASSGELLTLRDSSYAEPPTALTAFCGEECHTVGAEPHALLRELASRFHEPKSVPWDDVDSLLSAARATRLEDDQETSGVSKLLLAADDAATVSFWRPEWEALLGSRAVVTQAVPTMLEVLPKGHDKTTGFETLVRRLADESGLAFEAGVKPAKKTSPDEDGDFVSGASSLLRVVAVGDGENDAGMLRAASVGVALANACDETKRAADHVLSSSNEEDGVAEAVSKFVL